MTRRGAIAVAFILALGSVGQLRAQTLIFGGSDVVGGLLDRQNARFTELVNQRAQGKLRINFVRGESLGNDMQVIEQMMQGAVHLYGDVLDWYSNWVSDFAIFGWGFTFRDRAHLERFLAGSDYQRMSEELRAKRGLRILCAAPTEPRVLFAHKDIRTPADLADLKMRVPEIRTYVDLWQTLGTRPSRVAWAEVFLGLKTRVIEAAEGPVSSAYAQKLHQAARHVTRTDHLLSTAHITISDAAWRKLTPPLQKIVRESAVEACAWSNRQGAAEVEATLAKMAAEGAKLSTPDRAPFAAKANEGAARMERDKAWSPGLYARIRGL